jgi:hypothetical protein
VSSAVEPDGVEGSGRGHCRFALSAKESVRYYAGRFHAPTGALLGDGLEGLTVHNTEIYPMSGAGTGSVGWEGFMRPLGS